MFRRITHSATATPVALVLVGMLAASTSAPGATEVAFGPVRAQPGESLRLVSSAQSRDGTVELVLDERLELSGVIVNSSGTLTDSKKVTLPVNLTVTKSFVKGS